ncbi:CAP-Gly domain-containing linker protein 1-like [Ischnura elegans]|uniref:CAP-Gly domain-containing linker protein 1-like n=1 Tax=Ischnura elegans TaxID=197161 RepID=UPI001ED8B9BF|nr:CAP-Gly domain-containing linker protein 1-like [Ischnura elegans]
MAAKYVVLALAAICISQASAASHVRRSAEGGNTLEQMMENARTQLAQVGDEVAKWVNAPSVDEMRALMENKTKELEERTKSVLDEVKRQMETHGSELSERANAALQEATVHLNESLKKMKESAPELMTQASEMQQKFNEAFKSAVETMMTETGKIARAAGDDAGSVHDELANLSKSAMEQTLSLLGQFHNDVQAAVTRATSS